MKISVMAKISIVVFSRNLAALSVNVTITMMNHMAPMTNVAKFRELVSILKMVMDLASDRNLGIRFRIAVKKSFLD